MPASLLLLVPWDALQQQATTCSEMICIIIGHSCHLRRVPAVILDLVSVKLLPTLIVNVVPLDVKNKFDANSIDNVSKTRWLPPMFNH